MNRTGRFNHRDTEVARSTLRKVFLITDVGRWHRLCRCLFDKLVLILSKNYQRNRVNQLASVIVFLCILCAFSVSLWLRWEKAFWSQMLADDTDYADACLISLYLILLLSQESLIASLKSNSVFFWLRTIDFRLKTKRQFIYDTTLTKNYQRHQVNQLTSVIVFHCVLRVFSPRLRGYAEKRLFYHRCWQMTPIMQMLVW
jgi:hypothetical protein